MPLSVSDSKLTDATTEDVKKANTITYTLAQTEIKAKVKSLTDDLNGV